MDEKDCEKCVNAQQKKPLSNGVKLVIFFWFASLVIVATLYWIAQVLAYPNAADKNIIVQPSTYQIISLVIMFITFVSTTFFSFVIFGHNKTMRVMSEQNLARSLQTEAMSDDFRRLQFVSANYSVVEFSDNMLLYEQYPQYIATLIRTKDFQYYMCEDNIDMKDVADNFDNYTFLTVKLPFKVIDGKTSAAIRIQRFKFAKADAEHRFVPCAGGANTLILHDDENTAYQIAVTNLITKKDSNFYTSSEVIPFKKIKLNLTMYSLLGVAVRGWSELYFTNPRKLEKNGANQYKINSSQFKISGLPEIVHSVSEDI